MTLGRLLLAWLLVVIWFYVATIGSATVAARTVRPGPGEGFLVAIPMALVVWKAAEAALLTLFASLWFDSLGSGQWWVVFLLVGLLATVPTLLLTTAHAPRRMLMLELGELVRYLVAGALLAWRLS